MKHDNQTTWVRRGMLSAAAVVGLSLMVGCQIGPKLPDHIRAIWVPRFDYLTEGDVVRIIDNSKRLGMNTVLFQVRGNGTVFYPSKIEPWAEQFNFQDPGFDPLAVAIREAHQRDMRLEAYVNVMPAWRGPGEPADPGQLYHTHPEWFWYDRDGNRQPMHHQVGEHERDWYVSVNPCLPEVREYLVSVFREIAANYDIDGLHLDYIRFPNEPVVPGEVIPDYPRDARTLRLYRQATGNAPDDDPEAWTEWRVEQVTQLVRDIRAMLREERPGAALTAAVGADPERSKTAHFRDSRRWVNEGLLDIAYPMNYTADLAQFQEGMKNWADAPESVAVVQGIGVWRLDADALVEHIQAAEAPAGHFCLFDYGSFFETAEDPPEGPSPETQRQRAERRAAVMEYLADNGGRAHPAR
jgi:uncharacterized lipoprotein YddW (UPF0748 family)